MKLSGRPSRAAYPLMRRVTSISLRAVGTPASPGARKSAGISSNSASRSATPIVSSIALMSESVCGMKGMARWLVRFSSQCRRVFTRIEHRAELRLVVGADAQDPAGAVRVRVDELRLAAEVGVTCHDFAG